jgi:hypothetical protein
VQEMEDMALRSRPAGGGFKPPRAALAEDCCGERRGKGAVQASGGDQEDDCCRRVVTYEVTSKPGTTFRPGMSLADTRLLARWCPAWRWREPGLLLLHGTWEGRFRYGQAGGQRETPKRLHRKGLSTDAEHAGGPARSSDEAPVMGVERRGRIARGSRMGSTGCVQEEPRE